MNPLMIFSKDILPIRKLLCMKVLVGLPIISNLINPISGNDVYYQTYNNYTINDGSVLSFGVTLMGFKAKCKPNTKYTFSYSATKPTGMRVAVFKEEPKNLNNSIWLVNKSGTEKETFTTNADSNWLACGFYLSGDQGNALVSDFTLKLANE